MSPLIVDAAPTAPPRPVEEAYWVLPGRLLVGAHPGSRSRAQAMDRLRRFLAAGVTCFVDLTEPAETPPYEALLPVDTPDGRRVEYLREPIVDHGVPASRETMARILATLDDALESGHVVYLHCRAGIGRSATVAGCWLAQRVGGGEQALALLAEAWPQAAQSRHWPRVPETDEQVRFVLEWAAPGASGAQRTGVGPAAAVPAAGDTTFDRRVRGAWLGLALGDALGSQAPSRGAKDATPLAWSQHTALALCTMESLLATGRHDARDQIERFVRWQREGYGGSAGVPVETDVTPDVVKALATYLWRGLPMAGSHDPSDLSANSLPRVLAAATFAGADPPAAANLAAECSRTTHQSPTILDACRLYGAMLVAGLRGQAPGTWLQGLPATTPSCWDARPLQKDVRALAGNPSAVAPARAGTVLHALAEVRRIAGGGGTFEDGCEAARRSGKADAALYGALFGTVYGVLHGVDALPVASRARLVGAERIEEIAARGVAHLAAARVVA